MTIFMIINMTVGGLGIAYYRLLYIKASNWVRFTIGENNLLFFIGFVGLISTTFFSFAFGSGQGTRANMNVCMGRYEALVSRIV
jgi:hypothetical protein